MAAMRGPRMQVGSSRWIAEERGVALQVADSEVEEFSFSARNELDWLNEHMAGIFNENEVNFAETFKTPGKLRGRTPRTARKVNAPETRVPLSEVFSATKNAASTPMDRLKEFTLTVPDALASPSPPQSSPTRLAIFSPRQISQGTSKPGYLSGREAASMSIHMDIGSENELRSPQSPGRPAAMPVKDVTFGTVMTQAHPGILSHVERDQGLHDSIHATRFRINDLHLNPAEMPGDDEDVSPDRQLSLEAKQNARYADNAQVQSVDDGHYTSDGSSPIRPVVRKSSLNFASLPAREPLTAGKAGPARTSRLSHLEPTRMSYYDRKTGGKSLGYGGQAAKLDQTESQVNVSDPHDLEQAHALETQDNKSYTQRLQDQISKLGQTQAKTAQRLQQDRIPTPKAASPVPLNTLQSTPGAFPADDDDDWIEPPVTVGTVGQVRPSLPKSHSTDVMEGIQGKQTISQPDFAMSDNGTFVQAQLSKPADAVKQPYGHSKSASVPVSSNSRSVAGEAYAKKFVSVSNPSLSTVNEARILDTPSKSPSRSFRESPLKQVKNKLSSILKSSKGLLASSAALSAEGKSLLSPSSIQAGLSSCASTESLAIRDSHETLEPRSIAFEASPPRSTRRTRASAEREKEEKRREKEAKRIVEQNEKLEKARQKEREKARVFSKEQERAAAMEKQIAAKKSQPPRFPAMETPELGIVAEQARNPEGDTMASMDKNVDLDDATMMPPPSVPRPSGPSHVTRQREIKRPVKPVRETQTRPKQAPTLIRVNTGSQNSQYRQSTAQADTSTYVGAQTHQLASKASKASLQPKSSTQSLRGAAAAASRAKAQEFAAKKKQLDERDAQRRRDAKAEAEKKRIAIQEEQRKQEHLKRQEAERQKQQQQQQQQQKQKQQQQQAVSAKVAEQSQDKGDVQRKAAIERAKQTKPPPPVIRSQANAAPDVSMIQEDQCARTDSRMASDALGGQEELARPVNVMLPSAAKASGTKRTFTEEKGNSSQTNPTQSRGAVSYQAHDAKRRRTSEGLDETVGTASQKNIRGPPLRPSASFKKELPSKLYFQSGYSNATQSNAPNLFKATVNAQHASHMKAAHPLEMAQISKGAIPFAPQQTASGSAFKTPARSGPANGAKVSATKSIHRSSPRFQNGEAIELPEIQTDDDSEDDEANGIAVAPWANSPFLREELIRQEGVDPSHIFGPPAPLNMEEVFKKSKDRFHKFRARTSSANWDGADRLTEEDIRKDLLGRDKIRRDGGWSYEMSREML